MREGEKGRKRMKSRNKEGSNKKLKSTEKLKTQNTIWKPVRNAGKALGVCVCSPHAFIVGRSVK